MAAVSVNGVRVTHGPGLRRKVADGDRVMFVEASAGAQAAPHSPSRAGTAVR